MPLFDMTSENFFDEKTYDVFTFGRPPSSIDIILNLKGLSFADAFDKGVMVSVGGTSVRLIHYQHLIEAKQAAGRLRDLNDIEQLRLHHRQSKNPADN